MVTQSPAWRWIRLLGCLLALTGALAGRAFGAESSPAPLTNSVDIITLPAERAARSLPVSVTGIVTAADPALKGRFFLQDATGGVFVDNANGQRPEPGTVVAVTGITHPGAYAPIITSPTVRPLGTAPLPAAKPVAVERLMSGAEDSQRIEIAGVVRDVRLDGARLAVDLVSGGYRFRAYVPVVSGGEPKNLIAAEVRVRGTAAEAHNRTLRQLVAVEVYVPRLEDFLVEKREAGNPFAEPVVSLDSLAQYRRDNSLNRRVHVRGIVTLQRLGENLFLLDPSSGLQVQSRQLTAFAPGDVVEAVGFPSFDQYLPVLQDAVFRATGESRVTVTPRPVSVQALQAGLHHADFVSLTGRLLNRTVAQAGTHAPGSADTRTTLVLQSSNVVFAAEAAGGQDPAWLAAIPLGSSVQISGICLTEIDSDGQVKSFRILLGNPAELRVLATPSWLTARRLLVILGIVSVVSLVGIAWTVMLSRKNATLNFLIREREKAQRELQEAHDQLEERVKQRTEELKFQITARKEAELQFKAVLTERTRLAQELHDTVEQTLTGIALQLDTAGKLAPTKPEQARDHVALARNLITKSLVELRRSVWDLRQRVLEQFDLAGALLESARQITQPAHIKVDLQTTGSVQPLPEVVEENLLRIGQEALTNVVKHARATQVNIRLEYQPQRVILQLQDNGVGFDLAHCAGPHDGHFGLLGMSERAKRLGGRFVPVSTPGSGTVVRVEVPLGPTEEFQWPGQSKAAADSPPPQAGAGI